MSDPEHEKAFEDYLSRRAGIRPGAARPDDLEPPVELDRIVLANAREAIRIRNTPPPFRSVRWAVPVTVAATLILSVAVALHMGLLSSPTAKQKVAQTEARLQRETAAPMANTSVAADSAAAAPAAESAAPLAKQAAPITKEDPAHWLGRIESLRAQGKPHEAERELEAFRAAWPDFPIPKPKPAKSAAGDASPMD